ncbi:nuclear transport factor 2 family protein [Shewanella benthica]|nr:nuclear transport factor 2 family protein [Shewanella benthica]
MLTSLKQKLVELELYLLKSDVRSSSAELELLIHDDFHEFGASGTSFGKQEVLEYLPKEKCPNFCATSFELRMLSEDLAQLRYRATMKKQDEFTVRYSLRSSLWKLNEDIGEWQMIFHQGTYCERF